MNGIQEEATGALVSPVQREIESLTSMRAPSGRSEMVHFVERVRRLLFSHEREIVKEHLMALLDKIHELGQALKGPQLQVKTPSALLLQRSLKSFP